MISITSIKSVKEDFIKGSLALGASKTQTNFKVVLTSAKSGIFSGIILGVGRALGEATAVTMLANMQETSGLSYDIRFSVGVILIIIILITNLLLNFIKQKVGNNYAK